MNRREKGIAPIVSGIFIVAVAGLCFNLLVWHFVQAETYGRLLREMDQLEWEKQNENLEITDLFNGWPNLTFTISNLGSVPAHLVDVWLIWLDPPAPQPKNQSLHRIDIWINPSDVRNVTGAPSIVSNRAYDFFVVTERGNVVRPQSYLLNWAQPGAAQSMPFTLTFLQDAFQYECQYTTSWTSAWNIVSGAEKNNAIFRINITNTAKKDVYVRVDSVLDFGKTWYETDRVNFVLYSYYVVAPGSTTGALVKFTSQTIPAGKSACVYFGAKTVGDNDNQKMPEIGRYYIFLALYCQYVGDSTVYGSTVGVLAQKVIS